MMLRIRAIVAALCAFTWCSAVLHADLEVMGWVLEHAHWHGHGHSQHPAEPGIPEHPSGGNEDHDPVVARGHAEHLPIHPQVMLAGADPLGDPPPMVWAHSVFAVLPLERPPDPGLRMEWQFLWRCAPDAVAPPVVV